MFPFDARSRYGRLPISPLAAIALTAITAAPTLAQGPGGRPPGGGGRMGGGMVMGTVRQVDRSKNRIQVAGRDGEARWVVVSPEATMTRQTQGTLAGLRANDKIVVSGVPTAISASQLQTGEIPPRGIGGGFPGGFPGGPGPGGPRGGDGRRPGGGGERGGPMTGVAPLARVTGTIVSTKPLVVMLPGNIKLSVQASSSTKITKLVKQRLADVKTGDTLMAFGRPDQNNMINAMQVQIGVDLNAGPGFGGGAFRRRPDGGGNPP
jgi:hypothetical protein